MVTKQTKQRRVPHNLLDVYYGQGEGKVEKKKKEKRETKTEKKEEEKPKKSWRNFLLVLLASSIVLALLVVGRARSNSVTRLQTKHLRNFVEILQKKVNLLQNCTLQSIDET